MKTRLNQLSMAAFIELSCGNREVLLDKDETADERVMETVRTELMYEYKTIVNPAGIKSLLIEQEDETKLNARILLLKLCGSLCSMDGEDCAAAVMDELEPGYRLKGESMRKDVERRLREAEFLKKRIVDTRVKCDSQDPDDIRRAFDREVAVVMTYFKMSIDINTTSAAVYANIVNQASADMKRRLRR